jgi:hypothetical protein
MELLIEIRINEQRKKENKKDLCSPSSFFLVRKNLDFFFFNITTSSIIIHKLLQIYIIKGIIRFFFSACK